MASSSSPPPSSRSRMASSSSPPPSSSSRMASSSSRPPSSSSRMASSSSRPPSSSSRMASSSSPPPSSSSRMASSSSPSSSSRRRPRVPLLAEDISSRLSPPSKTPRYDWSPPPFSGLRRSSSSQQEQDDLERKAKLILEGETTISLAVFLDNLSYSNVSPVHSNLLNYLTENHFTSFCLRLLSFFRNQEPEAAIKGSALNVLELILTEKEDGQPKTSDFVDNEIKSAILDCFKRERSKRFGREIRNFVVKIVLNEVRSGNEWPEFVEFVYEYLSSDSEEKVTDALFLLYKWVPRCTGERLVVSLDSFYEILMKIFNSNHMSLEVNVQAAQTSNQFILYWMNPSVHNYVKYIIDLLIQMEETLFLAVENVSDMLVQALVEEFTRLAKRKAESMGHQFENVVESMFMVLDTQELEDETRLLALEFVVILAEERNQGRGMLLRSRNLIMKAIERMMFLLEDLKYDPEWETAVPVSNESSDQWLTNVSSFGMKGLARIAAALGGEAVAQSFPESLAYFLGVEEWQRRYAAVTSLAVVSETCSTSKVSKENLLAMAGLLAQIVKEDIHHRVRWAALNTLEEFSKHLSPEFQEQHHQQVLPALIKAMDDSPIPRVQAQAASAMVYFIKNCTSDILQPTLKVIVNKMLNFLERGMRMVKVGALRTLASIASSSKDMFDGHYSAVMPYLKVIMMAAKAESDHILLAASVECISILWMVIGKEKISKDTEEVAQVLISSEGSELAENDPMRIAVLKAWGRLCKCVGQEFRPYTTIAIPRLLKSAKPEASVIFPENPDNVPESDGSIRVLILGTEKIWIKTKVLEEKAVACSELCSCAAELKEGFYLWIDEVAQTLVPLLTFKLDEGIRRVSITAMPVLLKSSKAAIEKGYLELSLQSPFKKLCSYVVPALVKAISEEPLLEIVERILVSLEDCLEMSGPVLEEGQIEIFFGSIMQVLKDTEAKEQEVLEEYQKEKIYNKAGDCLITFIRTYRYSSPPFFGKLLPCIQLMWEIDKTAKERRIALRIFHEVAKLFREEAFAHYETSLPNLLSACKSENPEIQEACALAIGIFAEFGGSVFNSCLQGAVSGLNTVIENPNSLDIQYVKAHDAAVSSLGKVLQFHRDRLNAAQVLELWLNHLPIMNNLDEAKLVHHQLCSLVEVSDGELLGPNKAKFPKIVAVYAEILWAGKKLATEETISQMMKQLEHQKRSLPSDTWTSIISSLELHLQRKLEATLSSQYLYN